MIGAPLIYSEVKSGYNICSEWGSESLLKQGGIPQII